MTRPLSIAGLVVGLIFTSGCAALKDHRYESTQRTRAKAQYRKCGRPDCCKYPHDYRSGWLDGFYEVATGGSTCPPAVAPSRYWDPDQILDDCDNRRHAYYSGWQDGASRAGMFPDTHYLKIYETCECPFPKCEHPCGGGDCVPCGSVIGIPSVPAMIESGHPVMPSTETPDVGALGPEQPEQELPLPVDASYGAAKPSTSPKQTADVSDDKRDGSKIAAKTQPSGDTHSPEQTLALDVVSPELEASDHVQSHESQFATLGNEFGWLLATGQPLASPSIRDHKVSDAASSAGSNLRPVSLEIPVATERTREIPQVDVNTPLETVPVTVNQATTVLIEPKSDRPVVELAD
ncbi:MAG: hypothetical protein AAGA03_01180 [Planctomycetota bacterium]